MNAKSNVVPLRQKAERESEKKWGQAVMGLGYSMVPSLIFRAQARLGLNPVQLMVLLHLADYWWQRAQMPFPSKAALAERMGLSPRQIQRYMTELEKGGFIERVERFAGHKGQKSNEYDMTGLVKKLKKLEPEFSQVRDQAKEQAKTVAKRGGLARIKKVGEGKDE
jgi:predicted transcriptional regulator